MNRKLSTRVLLKELKEKKKNFPKDGIRRKESKEADNIDIVYLKLFILKTIKNITIS